MKKKSVGRPSKIDKEQMREADIWFMIILVILVMLLSVGITCIINPEVFDMIKASIGNLFN